MFQVQVACAHCCAVHGTRMCTNVRCMNKHVRVCAGACMYGLKVRDQ